MFESLATKKGWNRLKGIQGRSKKWRYNPRRVSRRWSPNPAGPSSTQTAGGRVAPPYLPFQLNPNSPGGQGFSPFDWPPTSYSTPRTRGSWNLMLEWMPTAVFRGKGWGFPFALAFSYISGGLSNKNSFNSFNRRQVSRLTILIRGKDLPGSLSWIATGKTLDRGMKKVLTG